MAGRCLRPHPAGTRPHPAPDGDARRHRPREHHLARAYETVATAHNRLGLTDPVDPATRPYHTRPFQVLRAERFAAALTARITDPAVRALPAIGAVDQFTDSTDVLSDPRRTRAATHAAIDPPV